MQPSLEIPRGARQPCQGSLPVVSILALFLVLLLGGCQRGQGCINSVQCGEGLVCFHYKGGSADENYCAKPCETSADCDSGESCKCPDSEPTRMRCLSDDGDYIAACNRW
jgi:hypothetical protein